MVGKKVMVLVNLKPAKLAGVLSEGMLLCAEDENGEIPDGTREEDASRRRDLLIKFWLPQAGRRSRREAIPYICDFRRCRLNVRLNARIQPLV